MAFLAQCLPVALIPEQLLIAPVRDDVIHYRRGHQPAFCLTGYAQWMLAEVCRPGFTSLGVIPMDVTAALGHDVIQCPIRLRMNLVEDSMSFL